MKRLHTLTYLSSGWLYDDQEIVFKWRLNSVLLLFVAFKISAIVCCLFFNVFLFYIYISFVAFFCKWDETDEEVSKWALYS